MTTFKIDTVAMAVVHMRCEDESSEEAAEAMCAELSRQLRADPRGKDLPEDPSKALDVLLRCTALLEAAGDVMPSEDDLGLALLANGGQAHPNAAARIALDILRPLFGAALAERNLWKDEGLACHMALVEIRKVLGISGEEWNNAQWSALVPRVKAVVEQANATRAPEVKVTDPEPERAPYTVGNQRMLDLALAFLDDVLNDASLPRVNRKTLPPLGAAGWATAWLAQSTLAKCAAARVQHPEVQRRIYVAAMELERVLFGLFDRAVPMAEEKKGSRNAAT